MEGALSKGGARPISFSRPAISKEAYPKTTQGRGSTSPHAGGAIASEQPPVSVRRLLQRLGLGPRKALGQHFLVSRGALRRILEAAEVGPEELVVEVGPGLGVLTRGLAESGARVVALELDADLARALADAYREEPRVSVLHADARLVDLGALVPQGAPYTMVANLPYYAATNILRRFLESERKPQRVVVMVQREVARRMVAAPGRLGLLGVGIQFYGKPSIVGHVPPGAFYPRPKVTSTIVRIDVYQEPPVAVEDEGGFFVLVRAGFSAPRKQLRGVLSHALDAPAQEVEKLLLEGGVEPQRRAESLSLQEWAKLHQVFRRVSWTP